MGHTDRMCARRGKDLQNKALQDGQYGEWLRGARGRDSGRGGDGRLSVISSGRAGEKGTDRRIDGE